MDQTRVEELIAAMTVEEKAGQLTQYFYFSGVDLESGVDPDDPNDLPNQPAMVERALARGVVGSLLFARDPAEINRLQRLTIEGNRHGIPAMVGFDVIHGFRTILPVPLAMAASFDPELVERAQAVAAAEARAVGIHWAFAPMTDVTRDARWGRIVEGAGEDPYLGAAMAAAQVRGFQGEAVSAPDRILAGPKHYAGYGFPIGGRDYDEAEIPDSTLWNVVLPPFKAAVDAGAHAIMSAYMDLNGVPATGNRWLLTDVLRSTWGFTGFVGSDANAVKNLEIQGFARSRQDAGARALTAGCDLEMAIDTPAFELLPQAVREGAVSEADLDAAVRRVLQAKVALGLFENPYVDEEAAARVLAAPCHREVAREAAERGIVLLRNENHVLPLDPSTSSVAVLGPLAASRRDILGPWVFQYDLAETSSILDGITTRLGEGARVTYAPGVRVVRRATTSIFDIWGDNIPSDAADFADEDAEFTRAVDAARAADVAVVVVGEWQSMIGEQAARSGLDLPGRQLELLQAVVDTGTPTVAVLMCGRPLDIRWLTENVPAILHVWYPGTRGGEAVARVLFGDVSPAARLPFTWPRHVGHVPMTYYQTLGFDPDHQDTRYWDDVSAPLYPFGYGLTYARFRYSEARVDSSSISLASLETGGKITVSVDITNEGERDADEVAQLYVHQCWGTSSRPNRALKGFRRLHIAAGATETVEFEITANELRYWSSATRDWVLDPADYRIGVGGDSTVALATTFTVTTP